MKTHKKQLVVLAGGQGSRMTDAGILLPKLLLTVNQMPLIEIIISEAIEERFTEILWCLGHGYEEVIQYFNERPALKSKIKNTLFVEPERRGTLGALIQARNELNDDFCLILGDLFLSRTNIGGLYRNFRNNGGDALLLVKYTDHPEDSDLVVLDNGQKVLDLSSYPHKSIPRLPIGNAGAIYLKKKHVPEALAKSTSDVFKHLVPELISKKLQVSAVFHQGLIRDIGTPERLNAASSGTFETKKLSDRTGIFFDRDGTLNALNGHIKSELQIKLYPHTSDLLKIALKNFDVVEIVTNQPVIARGEATEEDLERIHSYLLKAAGIGEQNQIIFRICPHHPDKGFAGEISELKRDCSCRKPASGLLIEALNENCLRSNNTLYIGDSITDLEAAQGAGIRWIHLLNENNSKCILHLNYTRGACLDRDELFEFLNVPPGGVLC